jgi:hypothetical protein
MLYAVAVRPAEPGPLPFGLFVPRVARVVGVVGAVLVIPELLPARKAMRNNEKKQNAQKTIYLL